MEGIGEPVDRAMARVLRRAVLDHLRTEQRHRFPALVHVGVPGAVEDVVAAEPEGPVDHALRADILAALLQRARRVGTVPLIWVTRPGPLEMQDVDAAWLSAARTATAEAGVELTLVVVTRRGWIDPRSAVRREWKRLRQR